MKFQGLKKLTLISLFLLASCKAASTNEACPKVEEVQKIFDNLQKGLTVEKVEPSSINNLCSVIIKLGEREKGLVYLDTKGKYFVSGNIIEIASKRNLTQEKLQALNRIVLNAQELATLERLVAFVHGNAKKYVYYITDPDCPFCKRAEEVLDELVKARKLSVKVLFFPLEKIHPEAKAKAISIICDKKGFEELKRGYKSNNQCEEGKKLVEKSQNFILSLGVRGTPTFVFPDGETKSGVLPKEVFLQKLGI